MKKIYLLLLSITLTACATMNDKSQSEYFKDFQTQVVALSQRIEILESKVQRDTGLKSNIYERVDKMEERINEIDKTITKIKNHPFFEGLDTVKLQPAPSSTVITIKPEETTKQEKIISSSPKQVDEDKMTAKRNETPALSTKQEAVKITTVEPNAIYNQGYEMYLNGKYAQAITIFREFLKNFPTNDLADNAQYWIGECYYAQKMFDRAIAEFKKTETYPDGNKIPDAYLKIVYSYNELGKKDEASKWKKLLLEKYANSEAAKKLH